MAGPLWLPEIGAPCATDAAQLRTRRAQIHGATVTAATSHSIRHGETVFQDFSASEAHGDGLSAWHDSQAFGIL